MATETLGVFGASGATGRHVVTNALELGWKVKALARTPAKLDDLQHENLTVFEGDFSNDRAIKDTLQGCTRVICCAGGPHSNFKYEQLFMSKFVRDHLWPALKESKPKSFLFQAGSLSKIHKFPTFGQLIVSPMLGLWPMAKDNDAVMRFIHENPLEATKVIVTRPGALVNGKGGSELKTSRMPNTLPLTFVDLGKFNVKAVLNEELVGKYPYVSKY